MNAAIYYHPEGYTTGGPRLMGRQAAGESFLRGYFSYSRSTEFWAQVERADHAQLFAKSARAFGRSEPVRAVTRDNLRDLARAGAVYHPGPGIGEMAWQRSFFGNAAWSLCGITHTTASARAMDAIVELPIAPVQPWDALICTSTAVRDNVMQMLQLQKQHLQERLGITRMILPQLPVIPLGIHSGDFVYTEEQRAAARHEVGADAHTLVVLFLGRLAFHGKAHPLAMYQALEQAAQTLSPDIKVVLIECGWHANDFMARAYPEAAALVCPSVRVVTLDGRKAENRLTAWAAADIFCSLSDNIQETFGITPIEAMAAGLPVVVADWDGYRDTVRDGIDGFRVPTLMPAAGSCRDLAMRHALDLDTYDVYCGNTCMLVAVDVEATAKAFEHLFGSAELRRRMGEAGRQRARELVDWATIIPQYEALWQHLAAIREAQGLPQKEQHWPARMDPFAIFAGYATKTLTANTMLALVNPDAETALSRLAQYRKLAMVSFADGVLPTDAELHSIILSAAAGPKTAEELVSKISVGRRRMIAYRSLVWLMKLHIFKQE